MNRSTWMLLALLLASLAWAYGASQLPRSAGEERLEPVWQVPADQVQRLEYRSGESRIAITVEPRKDGPGTYLWVQGEGLPATPSRRPRGRGEPPQKPDEPSKEAFQGGAQAQRFVEDMANLQAVRNLGPAKDLNLQEFGLTGEGTAYLALERRAGKSPLRLDLGAVSAGNLARYGLSSQDNRVYLIRNAALRTLSNPRRLMDRELFPFPVPEAQRIEVQRGNAHLSLHRLKVPPTDPNAWGSSAQDEEGNPALQEIVNGLMRIKAIRYLPDAAEPDKATATLSATLFKSGERPAVLAIYPARNDEALAVSSHTERPVALNLGLVNSLLQQARTAAAKR